MSGEAALPPIPLDPPEAEPDAATGGAPESWSLWVAAGLVGLLLALVAGSGAVIAAATHAGMGRDEVAALSAALLSAAYATVIGVTWLLARAEGTPFWTAVGAKPVAVRTVVGGAVLVTVVGRGAAALWDTILAALDLELAGSDIDPTQLFSPGPAGVAMTVLIVVVLAPIAEEIVFRGVLLPSLARHWGVRVAVVGSSALFAFMHVTPYAIVPIFVLAVALGVLFVRTGSLWVCIAAHVLFNATGLAALYVAKVMGLL